MRCLCAARSTRLSRWCASCDGEMKGLRQGLVQLSGPCAPPGCSDSRATRTRRVRPCAPPGCSDPAPRAHAGSGLQPVPRLVLPAQGGRHRAQCTAAHRAEHSNLHCPSSNDCPASHQCQREPPSPPSRTLCCSMRAFMSAAATCATTTSRPSPVPAGGGARGAATIAWYTSPSASTAACAPSRGPGTLTSATACGGGASATRVARAAGAAEAAGVRSTHPHTCTCTHTNTYTHTYMRTHTHTHARIRTHTRMHAHTHAHTHTCTHTYTRTHTHTYTHAPAAQKRGAAWARAGTAPWRPAQEGYGHVQRLAGGGQGAQGGHGRE